MHYYKTHESKTATPRHCHCCGAKIFNTESDYCSEACKVAGEKLRAAEFKLKRKLYDSPLYAFVRELEKYNAEHNTKYSYGYYAAVIRPKLQKRKKQP